MKDKQLNPESLMMTAGYDPKLSEGAVKCPAFLTSTYVFANAQKGANFFELAYGLHKQRKGEKIGLIYGRLNEPDLQIAEERLTIYEKGAEECALFSSGLAAITTTLLEFLKSGDVLLASTPLYGGTDHFLTKVLPENGIGVIFFNASQTKKEIVELVKKKSATNKLAMILIETPANPTNDLFDIQMLKEVADYFSSKKKKVLLAVDNTYLGPIWQHPIRHGADLVLYSATKYIGGHSDLIAGACLGSKKLIQRVKVRRTFFGNMSDPFTCWLLLRSLETLKVRMDRQAKNAKKIALYLNKHPLVEKVYFLGNLSSVNGAQYEVKTRQCLSDGAMIAFDVKGEKKAAFKFLNTLKLVKLAVSLGSTGSLAQHPYTMTHADVDQQVKKSLGITNSMIRLSVGIEDLRDIISDIDRAFTAVKNIKK